MIETTTDQYLEVADRQRLLLIDGHALIYRAYHAFPGLTSSDGTLVNAVYGFSRILLTVLADFRPEYCVVTFDHKGPTQRAQSYAAYKAHRPEMPDDLKPQIQIIKDLVTTLNIPQFSLEGYEADDLIGTITLQLRPKPEVLSTVITGDKDLFQLVDKQVTVWLPARQARKGIQTHDIEYDAEEVMKKMGVRPDQIVDLKALMGDASDNIPGVKGVGQKTAVSLISTFGSLDGVYEALEDENQRERHANIFKKAVTEKLLAEKDQAYLSQGLARIQRDVPIVFNLEDCVVRSYDKAAVAQKFEELEFRSLIPLLPKDQFELTVQEALF